MDDKSTLYVVATPIGNLEDITKRAERVLGEVDYVAAEDTRRTRKLLSSLGIRKRLISHYEPREERSIPKIISLLGEGKSVALVTDGGTPAISDPGYRLVRATIEAGIEVIAVPGPSALTAALCASGLPTDLVTFIGFLPSKKGPRQKALIELKPRPDTLVLFESPKRIVRILEEILDVLGDREAVVFREITKVFEEQVRGKLSDIIARLKDKEVKGEVTLLIRGAQEEEKLSDRDLKELIEDALSREDRPISKIASDIAVQTGFPRKKIYAMALEIKKDRD